MVWKQRQQSVLRAKGIIEHYQPTISYLKVILFFKISEFSCSQDFFQLLLQTTKRQTNSLSIKPITIISHRITGKEGGTLVSHCLLLARFYISTCKYTSSKPSIACKNRHWIQSIPLSTPVFFFSFVFME